MFSICFPYVFVHPFTFFPQLPRIAPGLAPQQRGAAAFDAGQMPGLGESVAGQLGRPGGIRRSRTPEPWSDEVTIDGIIIGTQLFLNIGVT